MSRRAILKSALGGLLLAPLLRERRLQAQNANPKRIITVFTPDSHPPEWWPTDGGDYGFTLQEPLADFRGLESEMLFVQQIDHSWTYDNHHVAGIVQLFTGARWIQQGQNEFADGPSLDQVLLQETDLRGNTPISSIQLGVDDGRTDARHVIAYSGSGQPLPGEVRPSRVYQNVFDGVTFGEQPVSEPVSPTTPAGPDPSTLGDQNILTVNMDEVREIQRYLGQQERIKLDAHLEGLAELEARLAASPGIGEPGTGDPVLVGGSCNDTETQDYSSGDLKREGVITEWSQLQLDLIYNAFTCDRTRVANMNYSFSGGHHEGLLGFGASWHDEVAHISKTDDSLSVGGSNMTSREAFQVFDRFWASQVAYLVRRLAETAEGDGTMLDNTLIYWGVESGTNHNHSPRDMQYLLIGGRNIGFQVGQFLKLPDTESAHKLHTAVLNTFGLDVNGFGIEPDSGALAGIGA